MPNARVTDPLTSHLAAASVKNLTRTKAGVLEVLQRSMIDEDMIDRYFDLVHRGLAPLASPSGIRSRRSELVEAGLVEATGFQYTASRRTTTVWRITMAGRAVLEAARDGGER